MAEGTQGGVRKPRGGRVVNVSYRYPRVGEGGQFDVRVARGSLKVPVVRLVGSGG
jgi:hypothetical protein